MPRKYCFHQERGLQRFRGCRQSNLFEMEYKHKWRCQTRPQTSKWNQNLLKKKMSNQNLEKASNNSSSQKQKRKNEQIFQIL